VLAVFMFFSKENLYTITTGLCLTIISISLATIADRGSKRPTIAVVALIIAITVLSTGPTGPNVVWRILQDLPGTGESPSTLPPTETQPPETTQPAETGTLPPETIAPPPPPITEPTVPDPIGGDGQSKNSPSETLPDPYPSVVPESDPDFDPFVPESEPGFDPFVPESDPGFDPFVAGP